MRPLYLGIDPGVSGGIAFVQMMGVLCTAYKFTTESDMRDIVEDQITNDGQRVPAFACLEKVHSMPKQGVTSSFTFGANYGFWRGLLIALRIPFKTVSPQEWQKWMRCQTRGDKNVSKRAAQELFPSIRITHAIADALLIGEYGRQKYGSSASVALQEA